jgi:hypothetical protein
MAQYKVLERSFINNAIVEEGAVVEYDGEASSNLELIVEEKPAKKAKADAADSLV